MQAMRTCQILLLCLRHSSCTAAHAFSTCWNNIHHN